MTEMGAAKVVGIDVSPGMIDGAKSHKKKGRNEYFLVGDAAKLKQQLIEKSAECNLMVRILLWVCLVVSSSRILINVAPNPPNPHPSAKAWS